MPRWIEERAVGESVKRIKNNLHRTTNNEIVGITITHFKARTLKNEFTGKFMLKSRPEHQVSSFTEITLVCSAIGFSV